MTTKTYRISNSEGKSGPAWKTTYDSLTAAKLGLMIAMGWDSVALSGAYESGHGNAGSAYETQEECDADQDGADAPRIEAVS